MYYREPWVYVLYYDVGRCTKTYVEPHVNMYVMMDVGNTMPVLFA